MNRENVREHVIGIGLLVTIVLLIVVAFSFVECNGGVCRHEPEEVFERMRAQLAAEVARDIGASIVEWQEYEPDMIQRISNVRGSGLNVIDVIRVSAELEYSDVSSGREEFIVWMQCGGESSVGWDMIKWVRIKT